jgi:hypothetical protein
MRTLSMDTTTSTTDILWVILCNSEEQAKQKAMEHGLAFDRTTFVKVGDTFARVHMFKDALNEDPDYFGDVRELPDGRWRVRIGC